MSDKLINADNVLKYTVHAGEIKNPYMEVVPAYIVREAPAVDAVEVVHGYWDDSGRYAFLDGSPAIRCSQCGCSLHKDEYDEYYWRYCPCCGSLMGERRKENAVD